MKTELDNKLCGVHTVVNLSWNWYLPDFTKLLVPCSSPQHLDVAIKYRLFDDDEDDEDDDASADKSISVAHL